MKIYSWNMLFRNKKQDDALRWIERLDFDVLCLQEVPEAFLEKLRSLPWYIAYAQEGVRHYRKGDVIAYAVVVSKHPIAAHSEIEMPPIPTPRRVGLFIGLMRPFHFTRVSGRRAVFADLAMPGRAEPLRVISAHLSLSHPRQRAFELALILEHAKPGEAIVCGDFNIIESPKVSLLNYLMGGPLRDIMAYRTERTAMEETIASHGLQNPLCGQVTHPFGLSQLDHILVPATATIKRCGVSVHAYGSDHRPIFVTTEA